MREFSIIEQYVKNTHAETHNTYSLKIKDVFKILRTGEEKRFKPFKKLHNRKLLWHGSRITNFAAILSQVYYYIDIILFVYYLINLNFFDRVYALPLKRLLLQGICLVKVYTLLIWYRNQPTIAWLLMATIQVYYYCVK